MKRATVLAIVCLGLVVAIFIGCRRRGRQGELVVVSFGGQWQKAQHESMMKPFAVKKGIRIIEQQYSGDYSLIKEKAANGAWDVVDVEPAELLRGAKEGIYEKVDYSRIDKAALIPSAVNDYGVGLMTYSIVLGFNTEVFPEGKPRPQSWRDFWDVKKFPGKRALHNSPQWMLEIALLADGVPPDKIYPIDMDRAFRSLDRIKPRVITFEAWAQPAQLLIRGDVVMSAGTNGRLLAAKEEGKPIEICWNGGIIASDYWVILKGSPNKDLAQEFVAYSVSVEAQRVMPNHILYGPSNTNSLPFIAPERRKLLPSAPEHLHKQVFFDAGWWLANKKQAMERYNLWLVSPVK